MMMLELVVDVRGCSVETTRNVYSALVTRNVTDSRLTESTLSRQSYS